MVIAVLAVSGVAFAIARTATTSDALPTTTTSEDTTTTTTSSSTTTTSTTTTTTTPVPSGPSSSDAVLERGERGEAVAAVQRRLLELHFDPGVPDGAFGTATVYAVQGFQKLVGMAPDGKVGAAVQEALAHPPVWQILVPDGEANRVEVDKARQLMFVYVAGELRLITHISTGSGKEYCAEGECGNKAITPEGAFRFIWRYKGWRESRLGKLYNPVYFTRSGVAVHGSTSVPTYPASHGCVRIPMHIAEYFPSLVKTGGAVYVLSGPGDQVGAPPSNEPAGPPPEDPPTSPDTTPESTTTTTTAPPASSTTTTTTTAPPPTSTPTTIIAA